MVSASLATKNGIYNNGIVAEHWHVGEKKDGIVLALFFQLLDHFKTVTFSSEATLKYGFLPSIG